MNRESISIKSQELIEKFEAVVLEFCTGLGKSKIAIDFISNHSDMKFLLVLYQTSHIDNWIREFEKWNKSYLLENIDIVLYASLSKYVNTEYYAVIYDEGHHLFAPTYSEYSRQIKRTKSLVLSATMNDSSLKILGMKVPYRRHHFRDNEFTINPIAKGVVFTITLNQAILHNIVESPDIVLVETKLDNILKNQTIILNPSKGKKKIKIKDDISKKFVYLNKKNYPSDKYQITLSCTEQEKYDYISDRVSYFKKQFFSIKAKALETKWLFESNERKKFLGTTKIKYVRKLLKTIKNKRYILFAPSISDIEKLGDNFIHSERKDSLDVIKRFNNKEINSLLAVNMLQEGQNLIDIDLGIIVQMGASAREFTQKLGRILRGTKNPTQYIFWCKGTKDDDYLEEAINNYNNIQIIKL